MKEPRKVVVEAEAPVLVVHPDKLPDPPKIGDKNIAPTTTAEDDVSTAGQRHINRVWEYTQAVLTIIISGATIYAEIVANVKSETLRSAFVFIVATYFARTNHVAIGGVAKGAIGR